MLYYLTIETKQTMTITFTYNNEKGIFDENEAFDEYELGEMAYEFLYNNLARHPFEDDVYCAIIDDVLIFAAFGEVNQVDLTNY